MKKYIKISIIFLLSSYYGYGQNSLSEKDKHELDNASINIDKTLSFYFEQDSSREIYSLSTKLSMHEGRISDVIYNKENYSITLTLIKGTRFKDVIEFCEMHYKKPYQVSIKK